jgi:hypothetical protein
MRIGCSILRWAAAALAVRGPCIAAGLAAAVLAAPPLPAHAQTAGSEGSDAVEAAFLFNFAKFTTWPPKVGADAVKFCVQANAIAPTAFAGWDKKRIQNRPVRVTFFTGARNGALDGCSIVFFERPPTDMPMPEFMAMTAGKSALTVSDMPGFSGGGGHIELYLANRRLRFKVNLGALSKSNLSMGAGVLNLAEIVTTEKAP